MKKEENTSIKTCEFEYSDQKICGKEVDTKYPDEHGKNHCIFHSYNEDKSADFRNLIIKEIDTNNESIRSNKGSAWLRSNLPLNYEGFYFPKNFRFFSYNSMRKERFCILSNVSFKNAEFGGIADFSHFQFEGDVDFSGMITSMETSFKDTLFQGNKTIFNLIFKGKVDFSDTKFEKGSPSFSNTEFYNEVTFNNANFIYGANFLGVIFKEKADFQLVKFFNEAIFSKVTFIKQADFSNANFNQNAPANFDNAKFLLTTKDKDEICGKFEHTKFNNISNFDRVTFRGKTDFSNAQFEHSAKFNGVQFFDNASFQKASFKGEGLSAIKSIFYKDADFSKTTFTEEANFGAVSFLGEKVNFEDLTCQKKILRNCTFLSDVNLGFQFSSLPFQYFEGVNFIGRADFTNKKLNEYRFLNCLMIGCSFLRSDIVDTVFLNCSWDFNQVKEEVEKIKRIIEKNRSGYKTEEILKDIQNKYEKIIKTSIRKNISTIDEAMFLIGSSINPGEIRECCMQLKNNRDKAKDFLTANKLYHSEMEMIRKSEWLKIKEKMSAFQNLLYGILLLVLPVILIFSSKSILLIIGAIIIALTLLVLIIKLIGRLLFLWIYKFLSEYGNNPLRAISIFILGIFLSSFLLIYLGVIKKIEPQNIQNSEYQLELKSKNNTCISLVINKPIDIHINGVDQRRESVAIMNILEQSYYLSMWNIINPFTIQSKEYKVSGVLTNLFIFIIQYIFRPLMIALIILAVRRKVKR